jgi:ABC-2 type transport system permease protein
MFKEIFLFELRSWSRTPVTYIYFGILLLLGFLFTIATGGAFDSVSVSTQSDKVVANAPAIIHIFTSFLSLAGIFITAGIIGPAVFKDFKYQTASLTFTTSVSRFSYIMGRFFGAYVIALLIFTGPLIGFFLGSIMPFVNADYFAPNRLMIYLYPFLSVIIPNTFFVGSLFFITSILRRSITVNWVVILLLYVGYGAASTLAGDLDNEWLSALIDPFGIGATQIITKYWTPDDRNTLLVTLSGWYLTNRLFWVSIGVGMLILGYTRFRFNEFRNSFKLFNRTKPADTPLKETSAFQLGGIVLPKFSRSFSVNAFLKLTARLTFYEFRQIFGSVYFRIIMMVAVVFMIATSGELGKLYDTETYPVTYQTLSFFTGTLYIFLLIIIVLYSGEMVWKERDRRVSGIHDALPTPNWVIFSSKLLGLMLMQIVLLALVVIIGVAVQAFKGYTKFELGLYLQELYTLSIIDLWLFCMLAFFIQVLANNKYLGYFITAVYYVFNSTFAGSVLKHNLLVFSSDPGYTYSDMNGYGHALGPFYLYKLYWAAFAILLLVIANMFWQRGTETSLKERWENAKARFNRPAKISLFTALGFFVLFGGIIFYNTNIINDWQTSYQAELEAVEYEQKYRQYKDLPHPKITSANLNIDVFPYEREVNVTGTYKLKNKTDQLIKEIHVIFPGRKEDHSLSFSPEAELKQEDEKHNYYIYQLAEALAPGDSMDLNFEVVKQNRGFKTSFSGTLGAPVYNGTFMNNGFLPSLGYEEGGEISSNKTRKKHDLPYKAPTYSIDDTAQLMRNLFIRDADFIDFEATISTSEDQIAIVPGYLQKEWNENGRRYFHYKMDSPIMNFYSFLSARYEVKKDKWNDVDIEIYYHKGHEYNLDRMIEGIKHSLDYYTENFSPYQHKQVRILEFPRYATFAQSFPNTIPYSEGIGFIADVREPDKDNSGDAIQIGDLKIDYPYYVTAHEVAHQWFAHQVIGGNVEGSNMLSETLSQYAALMVMKQTAGKNKMKKFLRYELNSYLGGRGRESEGEKPLMYANPGQGYILYRKGSVIMYALQDYIGEDSVNMAIKRYLAKTAFQEPPYTTTREFVDHIREVTPDSLQYLITDWFEEITLYKNAVRDPVYEEKDGKYLVEFTVESQKFKADSIGQQTEVELKERIEVGIFNEDGEPILVKKYKFTDKETPLSIWVEEKPFKVAVDPYYKLVDRNIYDNEKEVEEKEEP